jgi:hypothetical protein
MTFKPGVFCILLFLALAGFLQAQQLSYSLKSEQTQAVLNGGISYDLLRYPTNVSFDYPEGYLSFNIPLDLTTNKYNLGDKLKGSNEKFTPTLGARQRLNYSFRVNVPVLRGVLTYAQTENVNFEMNMNLGSNVGIDTTMKIGDSAFSDHADMTLIGAINLPIQFEMGWRTQTFGYAFKPMKDMVVAINLHKHLFEATANGTVNTNLLGNVTLDMPSKNIPAQTLPINYSEENVYGQVSGNYKGTAWSPAIGIKWWRFTLASRFGVTTKVKGHFTMKWHLPFFVNPEPRKFGIDENKLVVTKYAKSSGDSSKTDVTQLLKDFNGLKDNLNQSATDSFVLNTETDAEFNIPSGQTIAFDIIRDHLMISYTFIHGGAISGFHQNQAGDIGDTHFDLGFNVNHIITLNGTFGRARMTAGAFLLDFYETGKYNWLSKSIKMGNSTMYETLGGVPVPILNFATSVGSAMRVLLELDVLPIPALKSGLVYYL